MKLKDTNVIEEGIVDTLLKKMGIRKETNMQKAINLVKKSIERKGSMASEEYANQVSEKFGLELGMDGLVRLALASMIDDLKNDPGPSHLDRRY